MERNVKTAQTGKPNRKKFESFLDDVPANLPALTVAVKLQEKAGKVGFDWNNPFFILDKIEEELCEIRQAMAEGDQDAIEDETGDILFVLANLARHLKLDPEKAVQRANMKFRRRFAEVEQACERDGTPISETHLDKLEIYWQQAKQKEQP